METMKRGRNLVDAVARYYSLPMWLTNIPRADLNNYLSSRFPLVRKSGFAKWFIRTSQGILIHTESIPPAVFNYTITMTHLGYYLGTVIRPRTDQVTFTPGAVFITSNSVTPV